MILTALCIRPDKTNRLNLPHLPLLFPIDRRLEALTIRKLFAQAGTPTGFQQYDDVGGFIG